jgi:hypothetical protein
LLYARPEGRPPRRLLAFAAPAAVAVAFEFDQAAKAEQGWELFGLFEGAEHAGEIAGGGDLGADALPEGFAARVATEVVVAAGPGRLRHELQLTRAGKSSLSSCRTRVGQRSRR